MIKIYKVVLVLVLMLANNSFCEIIYGSTITPIKGINTEKKVVAFTFDDGPDATLESEIAKVFEDNGGHATFFNIGRKVAGNEDLIREIIARGHQFGNHSMTHTRLPDLDTNQEIKDDIIVFQELYETTFNYTPKVFRAPFLDYGQTGKANDVTPEEDNRVSAILLDQNLIPINANIYAGDPSMETTPQQVIDKITYSPENGSIILCHERTHTLEAMKILIPKLKRLGYSFVTVSELLEIGKGVVSIDPDDSRIKIHGAKFTKIVDDELIMHRHTDEMYEGSTPILRFNPEKAKSSTGISIRFKTKSPTVKVNLRISKETFKKKPAGGFIGIFQDLNSISNPIHTSPVEAIIPNDTYDISYEKGKAFTIDIVSENVGELVEYKITLPIFIDINLVGLELESGSDLVDYTEVAKPIYVAYGNSITHGRAQKGTNETYPYLISEWMNWELYNIAVGGGKTSKVMSEMIRDEFTHIDYMTVLIGYNDYAGGGESTATYTANYTEFLEIARTNHPNTKIYCLTLTATTNTTSPEEDSDVTAEEFRQVVRDIVAARQSAGDSNIFLIEGEDISTIEDLKKQVHFTVEGALRVADKLYLEMNKTLSTETIKNKKVGINIYPNPATDTLIIDSKSGIENVKVSDLSGKKIIDMNLIKNNRSIDISSLKAGTYILSTTSNYKTSTVSFIKK